MDTRRTCVDSDAAEAAEIAAAGERCGENAGLAAGEEPRWLSKDEQLTWVSLFRVMTRLPYLLDVQLQRDSGLNLFEYFALSHLSMTDGQAMPMSELAYVTNGSLSRLSNVVKRLEERGAVRRAPGVMNGRRCTVATLTDGGRTLLQSSAPGHVESVRHLVFDSLGDDIPHERLREICERMGVAMRPADDC